MGQSSWIGKADEPKECDLRNLGEQAGAESGSREAKSQKLELQGVSGTRGMSQLGRDLIQERRTWGEDLCEALHRLTEISFKGQSVWPAQHSEL